MIFSGGSVEEEYRRLVWILANQNPGVLRVSVTELVAAPKRPQLTLEVDSHNAEFVIRAVPESTVEAE